MPCARHEDIRILETLIILSNARRGSPPYHLISTALVWVSATAAVTRLSTVSSISCDQPKPLCCCPQYWQSMLHAAVGISTKTRRDGFGCRDSRTSVRIVIIPVFLNELSTIESISSKLPDANLSTVLSGRIKTRAALLRYNKRYC